MFQTPPMPEKKVSQMQKILTENTVRVAIVGGKAYWVKDNHVYTSGLDEEGHIDIDNAHIVDVFSLNEKETKNLLKIIDNLTD